MNLTAYQRYLVFQYMDTLQGSAKYFARALYWHVQYNEQKPAHKDYDITEQEKNDIETKFREITETP